MIFESHAPRWVRERVVDAHLREVGPRAAAEGPTRGGQDERVDGARGTAFEALKEGGVLGVDRQQQPPSPLPRCERQCAGGDEALLVRERERDATLECPEGRPNSGETDDSVQDDVRLRGLEQHREVATDLRVRDSVLHGERRKVSRRRGESTELELGAPLHDLDRLPADRAGGAEQRDSPHRHSVPYESAMTT